MTNNHHNDAGEKPAAPANRPDAPELSKERQVDGASIQAAESKRTNASDGSMNKLAQIAVQEASIELISGDTTVSRRNMLTENQLVQASDGKILAKSPVSPGEKSPEGPDGIAAHASSEHQNHSKKYHNHGDVYTCAMFVNKILADAGYKLHYEEGDNPNMVPRLNHALAHDKRFSEVKENPYKPHVGDVIIFGDHHSGVITSIGPDGPIVTYGGSTQTGATAETPLDLLVKSPGFAGQPSHIYRAKDNN